MKIILSPAKKMRAGADAVPPLSRPVFLREAGEIIGWMKTLGYEEAKRLWACSDRIASESYERLMQTELENRAFLTPAVLAYDGIAYQYMAPAVFEESQLEYVRKHLVILSGLYGALRAMDGVVPYRLEMQAKAAVAGTKDLYEYWGSRLYGEALDESRVIVGLASKEYSVCVERYLKPEDRYVSCFFGEYADRERKKLVQKGVHAKMARGDMVRFMAERGIEEPEGMKAYDRLGFRFSEERSTDREYVFIREA